MMFLMTSSLVWVTIFNQFMWVLGLSGLHRPPLYFRSKLITDKGTGTTWLENTIACAQFGLSSEVHIKQKKLAEAKFSNTAKRTSKSECFNVQVIILSVNLNSVDEIFLHFVNRYFSLKQLESASIWKKRSHSL